MNTRFTAAPTHFGNAALRYVRPDRLLQRLDYHVIGESPLNQMLIIYPTMIAGRTIAGYVRGKEAGSTHNNEAREHLIRDSLGALVWFKAKGLFERTALALFKPELLVYGQEDGRGKSLAWRLKAARKGSMPTAPQLKERIEQLQELLSTKQISKEDHREKLERFKHLRFWRSQISFISLIAATSVLGFVVPLYNIYQTRKNVAQAKKESSKAAGKTAENHSASPTYQLPVSLQAYQPASNIYQPGGFWQYSPATHGFSSPYYG
ncbi:MAG: hypothetical protein KTR14_08705 [Vampirovibrio sp.]|nr:hypothetical protein [Vampirovibrio sp.]